MKKEEIYIISPKIKLKTFKKLQKTFIKEIGIVPLHFDKMLWELIKDKRILCWFAKDFPHDMGIGLEIPKRYKNYKVFEIK